MDESQSRDRLSIQSVYANKEIPLMHTGTRQKRTFRRLLGIGIASALVVVACGGDDEDAGQAQSTDSATEDEDTRQAESTESVTEDEDTGQGESTQSEAEVDTSESSQRASVDGEGIFGGTFRVASQGPPTAIDGRRTTTSIVIRPWQHVMESLFALDAQGAPQPMLAAASELSDDAMELTIDIRPATFHNGEAVSAEDVVASVETFIEISARGAVLAPYFDGVEATDDDTVVISFNEPVGMAESVLADQQAAILPAAIATETVDREFTEADLIGTGPYQLVEWDPSTAVVLERYEDYEPRDEEPSGHAGRKIAYFDRIEFVAVPDESARLAAARTDQFDWMEYVPVDEYESLQSEGVQTFTAAGGYPAMQFNHAWGITAEQPIRQAILTALDIDQMAPVFGVSDLWTINHNLAPADSVYYTEIGQDRYNAGDVEGAAEMLAESGYDGEPLIIVTFAAVPTYHNLGLAAADQLSEVGFNVEVQSLETAAAQELRDEVEGWGIIVGRHAGYATPLANPYLVCNTEGDGRYCSDEMDQAIGDFLQAPDEAARLVAYEDIQTVYYDEVPFVKGPEVFDLGALSSTVRNFDQSLFPAAFWNVWKES